MKLRTRDLFISTLKQMGCECHVDGNEICFCWQGAQFCADVKNDKLDVDIWYHWAKMELNDIEKAFPLMASSMKWVD